MSIQTQNPKCPKCGGETVKAGTQFSKKWGRVQLYRCKTPPCYYTFNGRRTLAPQNYVSEKTKIGSGVKVWHFSYIGDSTEIGDNTKIGSLVHIDYNVRIGKRCKIEGAAYIPPLTRIGDDVFIGPGVVFTNDPYPLSDRMVGVTVEDGARICAGAVLSPGITVGKNAVVGMGSVVTRDVPSGCVVYGNPAKPRYPVSDYEEKRKKWNEPS